jgi:uncharacterized membrane protein
MPEITVRPSPAYSPGSDAVPQSARRRLSAPRIVWWGAVVALAGYFVATKAPHYYLRFDAKSYGPFWAYAGWLVAHITSGIVALLLGPLQFWTALRRRHARLHRWTGRVYVAAIAVGAVMAAVMLTRTHAAGWVYRYGLAGLTMAWTGTTALALMAIRRGNVAQHREWMVRSYVVTFGFVTFRVVFDTLSASGFGTFQEWAAVSAWVCWALPLLVTEFILQGRKILMVPVRAIPPLPE